MKNQTEILKNSKAKMNQIYYEYQNEAKEDSFIMKTEVRYIEPKKKKTKQIKLTMKYQGDSLQTQKEVSYTKAGHYKQNVALETKLKQNEWNLIWKKKQETNWGILN